MADVAAAFKLTTHYINFSAIGFRLAARRNPAPSLVINAFLGHFRF
jgi:hypothetical protein